MLHRSFCFMNLPRRVATTAAATTSISSFCYSSSTSSSSAIVAPAGVTTTRRKTTSSLIRSSSSSLLSLSSSSSSSIVPFAFTSLCHNTFSGSAVPLNMNEQKNFVQYNEIDLPTQSRINDIRQKGLADKKHEWVGIEKVHGTNFAVYLLDESTVRYAKRSGIMQPTEDFFGYHTLCDDFIRWVNKAAQLVKAKIGLPPEKKLPKLVINGELFGAGYSHPKVKKSLKTYNHPKSGKIMTMANISIQEEAFPQYSPELHFFAFDIKYSLISNQVKQTSASETDSDKTMITLSYDDFCDVASKVEGLLYAKAIVRGTLDQCLSFDVENFETPLPAILGMGDYPLKGNWAEGIIVRHIQHGASAVSMVNCATILKVRCSAFMELKHPEKQKELKADFFDTVRQAAIKNAGGVSIGYADALMPALEAAANNLLLNHVSEGRLSNVISKIGYGVLQSGEKTKEDLTLMLAKDALKDFLKDVEEPQILNTALSLRKALIRNCYHESEKLIKSKWNAIQKGSIHA